MGRNLRKKPSETGAREIQSRSRQLRGDRLSLPSSTAVEHNASIPGNTRRSPESRRRSCAILCHPPGSPATRLPPEKGTFSLKKNEYFISQRFSTRRKGGGSLGPGRTPRDPPRRVEKLQEKNSIDSIERKHCFKGEPSDRGAK